MNKLKQPRKFYAHNPQKPNDKPGFAPRKVFGFCARLCKKFVKTHLVNGGRMEQDGDVYRLSIPPTSDAAYADAQLDDYDAQLRTFINEPPITLRVRARFSSNQLKGTAGFGFWNAPFGQEGQVLASPNNLWFFHGSPESDMRVVRSAPGHGFKAAMLNAPQMPTRTMWSRVANKLLAQPMLARVAMRAAQAILNAQEAMLSLDMTAWHDYELDWQPKLAIFKIAGREVLRTPKPSRSKLGFVAWIDNYKAIAANGQYAFGYVACPHEQWLELKIEGGKISPR